MGHLSSVTSVGNWNQDSWRLWVKERISLPCRQAQTVRDGASSHKKRQYFTGLEHPEYLNIGKGPQSTGLPYLVLLYFILSAHFFKFSGVP